MDTNTMIQNIRNRKNKLDYYGARLVVNKNQIACRCASEDNIPKLLKDLHLLHDLRSDKHFSDQLDQLRVAYMLSKSDTDT